MLGFATLSLPVLANVADVSGAWNGRIDASSLKLPPEATKTKEAKAQVSKMFEDIKKFKIKLTLNKNKTFKVAATGNIGGKPINSTSEGKWTQSGNTITMTSTKQDGKPAADKTPVKATVSGDGRTMTLSDPKMMGAKVIFTR